DELCAHWPDGPCAKTTMRRYGRARCAAGQASWRRGGFTGWTSGSRTRLRSRPPSRFFKRWPGVGAMTDDRHHGKCEHDERDMAMPSMPGAGLVVIKTELILGSFEAVLDGPAMAFHRHQLLDGRAFGTPCGEKGRAAVDDVAADQKTPRPFPGKVVVVFAGVEIGQLKIDPVVPAWTFGAFAGRQATPGLFGKALRDRRGGTRDGLLLAPGMEDVIGSNTQNIAFARLAQQGFDLSRAIHAVGCHERERHLCGDCASDHSTCDLGLGRKVHIARHMRCLQASRLVRPFLWQVECPIDKGMAVPRNIGGEHSDLAIGDLARRASVLARDPTRGLALFQKAGLINDQNRVRIAQRFQHVLTYNVAQRLGVPLPAAQNRLLAPRAWIASRFRPHPTRLARLTAQQAIEKLPRRGRYPVLRKQRTDALLDVSQRRSPQRQRILNRRTTNHQIPNHGHPWIQNSSQMATVMLVRLSNHPSTMADGAGHASPGMDYRGADLWSKVFFSLLLFSHFLLLALWPHRGPIIATRRLRCCRASGREG